MSDCIMYRQQKDTFCRGCCTLTGEKHLSVYTVQINYNFNAAALLTGSFNWLLHVCRMITLRLVLRNYYWIRFLVNNRSKNFTLKKINSMFSDSNILNPFIIDCQSISCTAGKNQTVKWCRMLLIRKMSPTPALHSDIQKQFFTSRFLLQWRCLQSVLSFKTSLQTYCPQ